MTDLTPNQTDAFYQAFYKSVYERAIVLATKAHAGQKRWDGSDYIHHPLAVAKMTQDCGGTPEQVIAAILHDTVEDTWVSLEYIEHEFGPKVTVIVDALTQRKDQDESYNDYIARCLQTEAAILPKRCDTIHNLSSLSLTHKMSKRYIPTLQKCFEAAVAFRKAELAEYKV